MAPSRACTATYEEVEHVTDLWPWGGESGSDEQSLGPLNHITADVVVKARQEIQSGVTIGLNLPLRELSHPVAGRAPFRHEVVPLAGFPAVDDIYHINPQQSSQWDGHRHWMSTKTGKFYGGLTMKSASETRKIASLGPHARRGIVGRGVLVDIRLLEKRRGKDIDAIVGHIIELDDLQAALEEQGCDVQAGDILVIRTGFAHQYRHVYDDEKRAYFASHAPTTKCAVTGLGQSRDLLKWLWDQKFSAIVSDTLSVEYFPPRDPNYLLHDHLLAKWGMLMGELFDLDVLAAHCEKQKRWSFFFASAPFHHDEAVSSLSNAVAIL